MIFNYFNLAWKSLKKRKMRSWLTIIGIIISIATIFTLIALSLGLQGAIEEQFRMLGSDKFFIQPKGQLGPPQAGAGVKLTKEDVEIIKKINGVKKITYLLVGNAKLEFKDEEKFFPVYGIPEEGLNLYFETGSLKLEEGRIFEKEGAKEIIIGNHYKSKNIFNKQIRAGDIILINGVEFKVKGILEVIGNPDDDRIIMMSAKDMEELFDTKNRVDFIIVQIDEDENILDIAEQTKKKLQKFRNVDDKTQDFLILTPEELLNSINTILTIITAFLGGIAAISLLVGAIGITNTMYTSVLERTKEIGTMKAIGAKNKDVLIIFLIESGMIGLIGGILGISLGIGISEIIKYIAITLLDTNLLQTAYPLWLTIGCLAFAFLTGSIAGSLPAWQASKTNVVDALRYE